MRRSEYPDRDYGFGQQILVLRTACNLTQSGLAELLGVSRQAVVGWEAGSSCPSPHHLKHLIELCLQPQRASTVDKKPKKSAPCGRTHASACPWMKPGSHACWKSNLSHPLLHPFAALTYRWRRTAPAGSYRGLGGRSRGSELLRA